MFVFVFFVNVLKFFLNNFVLMLVNGVNIYGVKFFVKYYCFVVFLIVDLFF